MKAVEQNFSPAPCKVLNGATRRPPRTIHRPSRATRGSRPDAVTACRPRGTMNCPALWTAGAASVRRCTKRHRVMVHVKRFHGCAVTRPRAGWCPLDLRGGFTERIAGASDPGRAPGRRSVLSCRPSRRGDRQPPDRQAVRRRSDPSRTENTAGTSRHPGSFRASSDGADWSDTGTEFAEAASGLPHGSSRTS